MSIHYIASSRLPTQWGIFSLHGFEDESTGQEHLALTLGDIQNNSQMLLRVHSECLTGDALFSMRCDCGSQLQAAMQNIAKVGQGAILYLRQEGRGIGLLNKIRAYQLQDDGADTVEANHQLGFAADLRQYTMCKPMLQHLGINSVRLMTNNPRKVKAIKDCGVEVVERVSLLAGRNLHNHRYLETKASKLGHFTDLTQLSLQAG